MARLSEIRTDRNKEASEDKVNSKEIFLLRLSSRLLDKDGPKAIMKKIDFVEILPNPKKIYMMDKVNIYENQGLKIYGVEKKF